MPTITTVDAAWTPSPATFDDAEARRFDTAMFLGDGSNNGVRGGVVRHGDSSLAVSVNGSDQVTVQAGAAVIPGATGLGVYRAALSSATSAVAISARNATNPRIDLVVMQATGTNATVKTIDGTPSASPTAPALPAQHIELARITVPPTAGGAVTVDSSWRAYAAGLGGTLYVETANRLPGSGNQKGQRAIAIDTGGEHVWSGTSWIFTGWQNFTPNFPNLPINAGSSVARYRIDDDETVHVRVRALVISAATGPVFMDLPVPGTSAYGFSTAIYLDGHVVALNQGVGYTAGLITHTAASQVQFVSLATATGAWTTTVPHAWKNTDMITVNLAYERA